MKNYVWAAEFCFCHYEGDFGVISLHRTRRAAREARKKHEDEETGHGKWKSLSSLWRVKKYEVSP